MATLPWDIIIDILCRLPVKDLLRYRCVSKPWCSLIDGPDFINLHLKHSMETDSNLGLIFQDYTRGRVVRADLDALDSFVKLDTPANLRNDFNVVGSCNGIILLVDLNDAILWNPSTRRYRRLPIPAGNMFPPTPDLPRKNVIYGFGHDPINKDYKVLRAMPYLDYPYKGEVYSAKSNTWKSVGYIPYNSSFWGGFGVLVTNALHWGVYQERPKWLIVAFDLVTEEFREVSPPDFEDKSPCKSACTRVEALQGSLSVIISYIPNETAFLAADVDIWVMKEYGVKESWSKLFILKPSKEIIPCAQVLHIALLKTGNQVLMELDHHKIILYDFEREMVTKRRTLFHLNDTVLCKETLVGLVDDWYLVEKDKDDKEEEEEEEEEEEADEEELSEAEPHISSSPPAAGCSLPPTTSVKTATHYCQFLWRGIHRIWKRITKG